MKRAGIVAGEPPAELGAHIARFYIAEGEFDAAASTLQPLDQSVRPVRDAMLQLARALVDIDPDSAREWHERAGLNRTDDQRWYAVEAQIAIARGEVVRAAELLERANGAEGARAWRRLARTHERGGDLEAAARAYLAAARCDPTPANVISLGDRIQAMISSTPGRSLRFAILSSSTVDNLRSYLEVALRLEGFEPQIYLAGFGQYAQEILDAGSGLHAFKADVVVSCVHGRAIFPELYDAPSGGDPGETIESAAEAGTRYADLLRHASSTTGALVVAHTVGLPRYSQRGVRDTKDADGQAAIFAEVNRALRDAVREDPRVFLVNEDRLLGNLGRDRATDARLMYLAREAFSDEAVGALVPEYMRIVNAHTGRTRKCIVLDLDNTLWGGILGEDGPGGIILGHEGMGGAYSRFQRELLSLWSRGVLLAVASKNNHDEAMNVITSHPEMLIRPHHLSAVRINWGDKASNIAEIAEELDLGIDSFVFLDDNPVERSLVRAGLPQVLTVEMPDDPTQYVDALYAIRELDVLHVTDEDLRRGELYAQRKERLAFRSTSGRMEDHLAALDLVVAVEPSGKFTHTRVGQLFRKTNQFNLTGIRYSDEEIETLASGRSHRVFHARVSDRFGDHGLVGAAVVAAPAHGAWRIENLILSCRVLGQGVESAYLAAIMQMAQRAGCTMLEGRFIPTERNEPARLLFERAGFERAGGDDADQRWHTETSGWRSVSPAWVRLELTSEAEVAAT